VQYPLSLRNVEDLFAERGIGVSHETVRFWFEPVSPDVRRRDPQETRHEHARLFSMALTLN
jgi:putative transposase